MYRSHVIRDGLSLLSSIQGSIGAQAHGNVAAYGVNARVELAAADGRSADQCLTVALEDKFEQIICVIIIVAVVMYLGAVDELMKYLMAFPVVLDGLEKLCAGVFLLVKYQLLDGNKGVCTGCHAQCLGSDAVVFCTACGKVYTLLQTILEERGYVGQRLSLSVCAVDNVQACAHLIQPVLKLLLHALQQLIHVLVVCQVAGIRAKVLAQLAAFLPSRALLAAVQASTAV